MRSTPLVALLAEGSLPARGYPFETIDVLAMDRLIERAVVEPDEVTFDATMIRRVEAPPGSAVCLLTRDGHFAHRPVIVRRLAAAAVGRVIETIGYTATGADVMRPWMDPFRTEDATIHDRLGRAYRTSVVGDR